MLDSGRCGNPGAGMRRRIGKATGMPGLSRARPPLAPECSEKATAVYLRAPTRRPSDAGAPSAPALREGALSNSSGGAPGGGGGRIGDA